MNSLQFIKAKYGEETHPNLGLTARFTRKELSELIDEFNKLPKTESEIKEREEMILYWAKTLQNKRLSLHELVENARWLLDNVQSK